MAANSPRNRRPPTPEICPVCGEDVPRNALACPKCGADHRSGWREDADVYDGVDLPGGDFDYDEYVRREFGPSSSYRPSGLHPVWWITALLLLLGILWLYLRGIF